MKEAGIYCPSACEATLDESPEAYKSADEILRLIEPTVEVIHHLKPIWNLKATDMRGGNMTAPCNVKRICHPRSRVVHLDCRCRLHRR